MFGRRGTAVVMENRKEREREKEKKQGLLSFEHLALYILTETNSTPLERSEKEDRSGKEERTREVRIGK